MKQKTIEMEQLPRDLEYQILLTQRSIARAALHLGIDTLSSHTLTILQDALTQYIERMGRVMGSHVENSGRSSHHVNVLDAIRAVEDCALVVDPGRDMRGMIPHNMSEGGEQRDDVLDCGEWGDLVKFLYGSLKALDDSKGGGPAPNKSGALQEDGKNLNNISTSGGGDSGKEDYTGMGWYAPLDDYDSIPMFPVEIRTKDRHDNQDSSKRKRDDDIADDLFAPSKRMKNDPLQQQQPEANVAKGQVSSSSETKDRHKMDLVSEKKIAEHTQQKLPSYIPNFLPPFPPKHTYTKSTVPKPIPMNQFNSQNVRSSLVQLGRSYWGALPVGKEYIQGDRDASSSSSTRGVFVKVKTEPLDVSAVSSNEGMDAGVAGVEVKGGGVRPIVRASNTRFSKILEGSMDVH
mmetsp:Transcript_8060/g.15181  ORF Transcript_8060/g.15181 Transcript_8060/m.15181 type:complete len:404 (+) Transcript_8060:98-1309(+)|eukprot:CAMPEP_0176489126 /NCGR_PEP_ID=MMETSP0200_2-20121128/7109_1 /TAXON_ID=947934 /ORGANISM="Chaetoceros sp., Strain GSL56" /LENGTH=403 /DNA_ID=CAMNT_0017886221 /DNA_START=59 /DNA_END=1270 /DNA_ORIENTATION=-